MRAWPRAELDEVLHLWSGLGYYARARNLQRAAQILRATARGEFPATLERCCALPGIGRSTAGAILALSRGERHPILDGNVKRVLARVLSRSRLPGEASSRAAAVGARGRSHAARASPYTQAIMDLGATVCTRSKPACLLCPREFRVRRPARRPQTCPRRAAQPRAAARGVVLLRAGAAARCCWSAGRRAASGVACGACPNFRRANTRPNGAASTSRVRRRPRRANRCSHAFSHFDYDLKPLIVRCAGKAAALRDDDRYRWYDVEAPAEVGVPKPIATLLQRVAVDRRRSCGPEVESRGQRGALYATEPARGWLPLG